MRVGGESLAWAVEVGLVDVGSVDPAELSVVFGVAPFPRDVPLGGTDLEGGHDKAGGSLEEHDEQTIREERKSELPQTLAASSTTF